MTLQDLIDEFRERADDKKSPPLWSDAYLARQFREAQEQACRRSRILIDSVTAEICSVTTLAANPVITLDPRVIRTLRVKSVTEPTLPPLAMRTLSGMDAAFADWETQTSSTPRVAVTDYSTGTLRIFPTPNVDMTFNLQVQRLPLDPLVFEDLNAEPEINSAYHMSLVAWALYRAFGIQDVDTYDEEKSMRYLKEFRHEFGHAPSAKDDALLAQQGGRDWATGTFE